MIFRHLLNMQSHPTWVRGLKLMSFVCTRRLMMSHPTWVRGLKRVRACAFLFLQVVAPYVGAWIETLTLINTKNLFLSHPTWVRGLKHYLLYHHEKEKPVAPYVGAWIETDIFGNPNTRLSRTLRGCVD